LPRGPDRGQRAADVDRVRLAGAGPGGDPGRGQLGDLGHPDDRDPDTVDRGDVRGPGGARVPADADVGEPRVPGCGDRVVQAYPAVVEHVVVGHRDQVDAGRADRGERLARGPEVELL